MRIYSKKTRAEFHPDRIWTDGALGFFVSGRPNNNNMLQEEAAEEQDD